MLAELASGPIVLIGLFLVLAVATLLAGVLVGRKRRTLPDSIDSRLDQLDRLSQRLGEFETTLTVPQRRGRLGEQLLEQLLASWLPRASFDTQVALPGGARVDVAVKLGDRLLAIDAKFPHEALQPGENGTAGHRRDALRALRRHVDAVADKYVSPGDGLHEFALLYVPSDALYLRWFAEDDGLKELRSALKKRVVPVGPSGLYLYLHTVGQALLGMELASDGAELAGAVQQIAHERERLAEALSRSDTHVQHLIKAQDAARSALRRVDRSVGTLSGLF